MKTLKIICEEMPVSIKFALLFCLKIFLLFISFAISQIEFGGIITGVLFWLAIIFYSILTIFIYYILTKDKVEIVNFSLQLLIYYIGGIVLLFISGYLFDFRSIYMFLFLIAGLLMAILKKYLMKFNMILKIIHNVLMMAFFACFDLYFIGWSIFYLLRIVFGIPLDYI